MFISRRVWLQENQVFCCMHAGKAGVELGDEAGYMYVNDLGFRVMVRFSSLFIDTLKKE